MSKWTSIVYKFCNARLMGPLTKLPNNQTCKSCARPKQNIRIFKCKQLHGPRRRSRISSRTYANKQMLILKVIPNMKVFKLKWHQTGYSGHIINFSQDIATFSRIPTRTPTDIAANVIVARRETQQQFSEFKVNSQALRTWLQYLKANNPYYADVQIFTR